jgi:2-polyprenyl-3-methyl-5-hydroxy-6-metoxy-1,4-benzoquinol methylase
MPETKCLICGNPQLLERFPDELAESLPTFDYTFTRQTRRTYRIAECKTCSHQQVDPMPSIESAYGEVIDETYLNSRAQRLKTAQHLLKEIRLRHVDARTLLDVGCNTGFFLDEASKHFQSEGLELSKWAAEIARRQHIVHSVPLVDFNPRHQFDIVTLLGVIEHFEDPVSELKRLAAITSPNGLLVIFTGTRDSWLPRLLQKKWWWYQGMHLQYFTKSSLTRAVKQAGFEIPEIVTHTSYFSLESLFQSAQRYPLAKIWASPLKLPGIRGLVVPVKISGESLLFTRKQSTGSPSANTGLPN